MELDFLVGGGHKGCQGVFSMGHLQIKKNILDLKVQDGNNSYFQMLLIQLLLKK